MLDIYYFKTHCHNFTNFKMNINKSILWDIRYINNVFLISKHDDFSSLKYEEKNKFTSRRYALVKICITIINKWIYK